MKIKFDGHQDFQLDAIRAAVDVFAGQPLTRASLRWQSDALGGELLTEMGVGNSLALSDEAILSNVRKIQAFDKSSTVIQNTKDQMNGRRPIEFIQHARPVVVVDEPQNLATELRTKAIESLNPLCTLRYSATHKDYFNLVYRLDPVRAYDLRLVKRIEVDSVVDGGDFNRPYIAVKAITATKTRVAAKLEIDVEGASGARAS
jgi:restriction endonuclease